MGGGGFWAKSSFHIYHFTFNEKIMYKNLKRMIKKWWEKKHSPHLGGGFWANADLIHPNDFF